ncbi:MAG: hypothetical protein ABEJ57_03700 [Halobacteriaceae archaeon]
MNSFDRSLVVGLVVLAVALAANAIAGPLLLDAVDYPFSETLVNQTIGLEAVTLAVVVPWTLIAALLVARDHPAGPLLAIAPAGYAAYMLAQYVLGPQYQTAEPIVIAHLLTFILAAASLVVAWARSRVHAVPRSSRRRRRVVAGGLFVMAAFTITRYLDLLVGATTGAALPPEYAADPTMYWTIVLLDLGVVVPTALATGIALLWRAEWARRAAYAVVGWFVLVPVSVTGMSVVMYLNNDPYAGAGDVALFAVATLLFIAFAAWVYRPLLGVGSPRAQDVSVAADPSR